MTIADLKHELDQMLPEDLDKIVRIEFFDSGSYIVERDATQLRQLDDIVVLSS